MDNYNNSFELINYYDKKSIEYLYEDKEIKSFKEELDEEFKIVNNFKYNKSIAYKLIHPIKTIKNYEKFKKVMKIDRDFNRLVTASVMNYNEDQFGNLEDDLEATAKFEKPKVIKKYIKTVSLK